MSSDESKQIPEEEFDEQASRARALIPYSYAYPAAEIDLVGLGAALWRRWKLMLVVWLLVFCAALASALLHKPSYDYNAVMRTGTVKALEGNLPLVAPESLAVQIRRVYIPQALDEAVTNGMSLASGLMIEAKVENNSNTVTLITKAGYNDGAVVSELLGKIVTLASNDINRRLSDYLARDRAYLKDEIKQIQRRERSLEAQAAQLSGDGGGNAAAASYVATQVAALVQQGASLRQDLDVLVPSNVEQAGLVGKVARSVKPTGLGIVLIVVLGAVAGLMLALLAAAVAIYVSSVRGRLIAAG